MEKQKVMFAFNDETKWEKIIGEAEGMLDCADIVENVAIVSMGTTVLSILKSTILTDFKDKVSELSSKGVDFYICCNTMHKYGITADMILPEIKIAERGTDIKILELKQAGYIMYTVDYVGSYRNPEGLQILSINFR